MIQNIRVGDENVNLPLSSSPPTTREALVRAAAAIKAKKEAQRALDAADRELRRTTGAWPRQQALALADGAEPGDNPIPAAEAELETARQTVRAHIEAERIVGGRLRRAVMADREAWTTSATTETQKALGELATAIQMAEGAYSVLYDNLGVLGMYRNLSAEGSGYLSVVHVREASHFEISAAIGNLRVGLNKATQELDAHTPRKARKGKTADARGDS